jgi:hypothetical protein
MFSSRSVYRTYAETSLLARRPLPSTCVELGGTSDSTCPTRLHSEAEFCSNLDLDTFSNNIAGTSYHLKGSLFKINPKRANDKKN